MRVINVEIKAYCKDQKRIRDILSVRNADFRGTDRQVDTYFNSSSGRLKRREGEIKAQSEEGDLSEKYLRDQCSCLMEDFGITKGDLIHVSYSDLMMGE